ncbi:hypothetical protein J8273_2859 [Carpediemonas membranifera]|uniref:Uncharacterized protein n=1 Tax=Carpediemonas membranifera TaxID=201153 RepID=A0A8J6B098_9EUKA|nr:hypothetical protein J8273_2859 [Carpediemonas membranifera]|eukprot:KAG9395655.1 hypothetical protein J8273_2859 [Carpediemonas membranifera]
MTDLAVQAAPEFKNTCTGTKHGSDTSIATQTEDKIVLNALPPEEIDTDILSKALNVIEPLLQHMFRANIANKSLLELRTSNEAFSATQIASTMAVQVDEVSASTIQVRHAQDLLVSSINASGVFIAIAFGSTSHSTESEGRVFIVNHLKLASQTTLVHSEAIVIDTMAPVSALAFHPVRPHIIAVADSSGVVSVYDLSYQRNPERIATTEQAEFRHNSAVVAVHWVRDVAERSGFRLVSVGQDSLILHLRMSTSPPLSTPVACTTLAKDVHTRTQTLGRMFKPAAADVPALAQGTLLVGTREGAVMLVNTMLRAGAVTRIEESMTAGMRSQFVGHFAGVTVVAASPLSRQLFLTASLDETVLVRHTGLTLALAEIALDDTPYAAAWSPHRPCVFAVACESVVYIFDLTESYDTPAERIDIADSSRPSFVQFNAKYPGMLVCGTVSGRVTFVHLSNRFTQSSNKEEALKKSLEATE